MELPKNGGIVIIDDKINEAVPLMNALAKRGVSYSYYDGKPRNYPKEPLESVRLIFLDMHLDEVAGAANGNKNIISSLIGGLDVVVGEDNGPYAIMVWSKHDSQHMKDFKKAVVDNNGLHCKPIAILNMEKSKCFESVYREEQDDIKEVEWKLKDNGLEIIEQCLEVQIKSVDAFVLLYNWENGIRESAKETIKSIGEIFVEDNRTWNDNLKSYFVKIAKAYAGKMLDMSNDNIIRNVYYSLNDIMRDYNCALTDKISEKIKEENSLVQQREGFDGLVEMTKIISDKEYVLAFDLKTYCLYEDGKIISQGKKIKQIFEITNPETALAKKELYKLYWSSLASVNSLLHLRNYMLNEIRPGNIYLGSDEVKKEICDEYNIADSLRDDIVGIELEISPICDYSQKKRTRMRILPGLMLSNNVNDLTDNSKFTYITAPVCINGKIKRLLFDFRYFTSEKEEYLKRKKAFCAISDELLQNIKEKLLSHVARGGIVVME